MFSIVITKEIKEFILQILDYHVRIYHINDFFSNKAIDISAKIKVDKFLIEYTIVQ